MRHLILSLLFSTLFTLPVYSTILIQQEDTWNYCVLDFDLHQTYEFWDNLGYDSFVWDNADWIEGQAAFGSGREPEGGIINTDWTIYTDLALRTTFELESIPDDNLILNVAVDNGCIIFINGQEVARCHAPGFTIIQPEWEYTFPVDSDVLELGTNTVSVFAEDYGGYTYFDMKLEVVPEPTTISLFGLVFFLVIRKNT